jgi:sugar phosphate isomerase/epimerase
MKLGFSSVACPQWDLDAILSRAPAMGYSAIELAATPAGRVEQQWPALKADAAGVGRRFHEAGLELICLATEATLSGKGSALADAKGQVCSAIELAAAAGASIVRVLPGSAAGQSRDAVLARIVDTLGELAPVAAAHRVTLAIENSGDFSGSRDLWFIVDAVDHPFVQVCWSAVNAAIVGDRMTLAVPRIARMMSLTHVADAQLADGRFNGYALPGQGNLDVEHYLDLLRGVGYAGGLIFHWPRAMMPSLAGPDEALPAAATALKGMLEKLAATKDLTAYKGDKNAPKYKANR